MGEVVRIFHTPNDANLKVWKMPRTADQGDDGPRWFGFIKPEVTLGTLVVGVMAVIAYVFAQQIQTDRNTVMQTAFQTSISSQLTSMSSQITAINAAISNLPVQQNTIAGMQDHLHGSDVRLDQLDNRVRATEQTLGQLEVRVHVVEQLLQLSHDGQRNR